MNDGLPRGGQWHRHTLLRVPLLLVALPLWAALGALRRLVRLSGFALKAGLVLGLAALLATTWVVRAKPYPVDRLDPGRGGPLIVEDRRGEVLYRRASPDGRPGRRGWVTLDQISTHAVLTVLASEDRSFFDHRGVDPEGILRAAALNVRAGRVAYGGSTITMQLVRMIHSRGKPRTLGNKLQESVLALRLERTLTKEQILEQYLNRAYYGHGAYGIEAAAQRYFGKSAASLSPGEATLLAVIPRAPSYYDPIQHPDRIQRRRRHVFRLLRAQGLMSGEAARRAQAERVRPRLHAPPLHAPHFVQLVLDSLPAAVKRRGGTVRTSLDLALQKRLERRVAAHVASLRHRRIRQAGMVVLDTATGEVRAMVGSAGPHTPGGHVNITVRRRHPGSTLKPFIYALALERGDHPGTIAYDINELPGSAYRLLEVTQRERGPVRYREALAGSYNIAAVHTLEKVGIDSALNRLRRAGLGPLPGTAQDYGLQLALGSPRIRLLDLAAAYGFLARSGRVTSPRPLLRVTHHDGRQWIPPKPAERQLFSPEVSWLIMDMLSDPQARRPMFGAELPVDLPYRVAVKTGTSRGFADMLAVAVTRELTVAAWAGSFDGKPAHGIMAMQAAGPLVRDGLLIAGKGAHLTLPPRPATVVKGRICPLSGMAVGPSCPHRKVEYFIRGKVPTQPCSWHGRRADGHPSVSYPGVARCWVAKRRRLGGKCRVRLERDEKRE